jgi:hypothetical protein
VLLYFISQIGINQSLNLNFNWKSLILKKDLNKWKTFCLSSLAMGLNPPWPASRSSRPPLPFSLSAWTCALAGGLVRPSGQFQPELDSSSSWRRDQARVFIPRQKIHRIQTDSWFKLRLEIDSGLDTCYAWSVSKTPINRWSLSRNFIENRSKPQVHPFHCYTACDASQAPSTRRRWSTSCAAPVFKNLVVSFPLELPATVTEGRSLSLVATCLALELPTG